MHRICSGSVFLSERYRRIYSYQSRSTYNEAGATVDIAWNGKEAVEAVTKAESEGQQYDAVLMDIMMPVMNGYEATKAIRSMEKENSDDSHMPIIAMTANAFVEDAARCREAGMDAHVAKPLDINRIITVIDRYTR